MVATVCSYVPCLFLLAAIFFVNSQTLKITLGDCDFNKEAAGGLLQAVGDRRLSLTITHKNMYVILLIVVDIIVHSYNWFIYRNIDVAQSLVDALCLVTLPGLIELE